MGICDSSKIVDQWNKNKLVSEDVSAPRKIRMESPLPMDGCEDKHSDLDEASSSKKVVQCCTGCLIII